jgi:CRISPR-associated protein Cmr6
MKSRREALDIPELQQPAADTNAGLWLDKGLSDPDEKGGRQAHIEQLSAIRVTEEYRRFYERWKKAVQELGPFTQTAEAAVVGRMIVGLGAESVLETAIALHRTYGMPYIPGSSLKGLVAATAHQQLADPEWHKSTDQGKIGAWHRLLFGDQESSGYVTFHDALWIPEGTALPLDPDVMTVHHPNYYQGKDNAPAADWDSPNPVAFVTAHGRFLLALTGPQEWAEKAMEILKIALEDYGAGAKTAAGYGRMQVTIKAAPAKVNWEPMIKGVNAGNAGNLVPRVLQAVQGEERSRAAKAIIESMGGRRFLRSYKDKNWAKLLIEAAGE